MRNFFKTFFASALGTIFAMSIVIFLAVFSISLAFLFMGSNVKGTIPDSPILKISLNGVITEREVYDPFSLAFLNFGIRNQGLNDILAAIKNAKESDKVKGIYLDAGFVQTGAASMREIRDALIDFKESGKFIVAYGEMISQRTYYTISVADKIVLNPIGMLDFRGLGSLQQYHKGILEKWGIEVQAFKAGTYKSYIEPYTRENMSEEDRKQRSVYLNLLWKETLNAVSDSRKIPVDSLNRYADEYLLFSAPESMVEYGLIDSLAYKADFEKSLKEMAGIKKDKELKFLKVSDMLDNFFDLNENKIAILYAEGSIVSDSEEGLYSGSVITAKTYLKEIKNLQKDSTVKAVVFRINSGGGSAFASDQIWHGITELSKIKPVVASFGSYAASGGYYIACGASKIVSSPTTLTGSIGVFGLFPSGKKLADKMGASYDGVGTNKNTMLGTSVLSLPFLGIGLLPARPLNESEFAMLQAYIERGYDSFLSRCSQGRGISKEAIDAVGQGRVWAGSQAVEIGLADTLGGIETAVEMAADLAKIEDYSIEEYPMIKDPIERFFGEIFGQAKATAMEFILGKEAYETRQILKALSEHDYRQAIMLEELSY
ncbi:MAG: signal peptide peptidase SppA [Fibromonadaceae bacterium]|jgi:protease-4|nr:signal peptide peptidase SppA [Fibromonadaceae bacterium]